MLINSTDQQTLESAIHQNVSIGSQLYTDDRRGYRGLDGVLYQHKLIHGDTLGRKVISEQSVDLTVTSPPYNAGMAYSGKAADDAMAYDDYLAFSKKRCIKFFSFKGDTVLDPFMGSGTTMIEAIGTECRAIGIEREERYCQLTRKRVLETCGMRV